MTKVPDQCYWDSCVFLSLIEGHEERCLVLEAIIDECKKGTVEIYTSVLSIAEVAFGKAEKDGAILDATIETKIDKLWLPSSPFKLVDAYSALMFEAKALMREVHGCSNWSLKPADAIHIVTAQKLGVSTLHTYDERLFKYGEITGLKIEIPRTDCFVWSDGKPEGEPKE